MSRNAARFWEIGRIPFVVATGLAGWFGYLLSASVQAGLGYPQNGTLAGLWLRAAALFALLNLSYSSAYLLEFLLRGRSWWNPWGRLSVLLIGSLVGVVVAVKGGAQLGFYEFSFRA